MESITEELTTDCTIYTEVKRGSRGEKTPSGAIQAKCRFSDGSGYKEYNAGEKIMTRPVAHFDYTNKIKTGYWIGIGEVMYEVENVQETIGLDGVPFLQYVTLKPSTVK